MTVKRTSLFLVGLLIALVALVAAGCGGDGGGGAPEALPSSSCTAIEYEGDGDPEYIVASDFPLQGSSRTQTEQIVAAIRYELDQRGWAAGDYKTFGAGWQRIIQHPGNAHLFLLSLLREHHPEATELDSQTLAMQAQELVAAALVRVVPRFFAILLDGLPLPTDQRAQIQAAILSAVAAQPLLTAVPPGITSETLPTPLSPVTATWTSSPAGLRSLPARPDRLARSTATTTRSALGTSCSSATPATAACETTL